MRTIKFISINSGDHSVGIGAFEVTTIVDLPDYIDEGYDDELIKHFKDFLNEMFADCTRCITFTEEEFEKMESEQEKYFTKGD